MAVKYKVCRNMNQSSVIAFAPVCQVFHRAFINSCADSLSVSASSTLVYAAAFTIMLSRRSAR